jgi:hypothetical protein
MLFEAVHEAVHRCSHRGGKTLKRLERVKGIGPSTRSLGSYQSPLKPAEIRASACDLFPFRSSSVHAKLCAICAPISAPLVSRRMSSPVW